MNQGYGNVSLWSVLVACLLWFLVIKPIFEKDRPKTSSYTQWNQNTYQINDTLFVITAEGDTAKFILKQ